MPVMEGGKLPGLIKIAGLSKATIAEQQLIVERQRDRIQCIGARASENDSFTASKPGVRVSTVDQAREFGARS
jgi:hypothetical protein